MKKVYIAGPISASDIITVLGNLRRGIKLGKKVIKAGFAVFTPHLDFHLELMVDEGEADITVKEYKEHSMAWLEVSDAVLLLPGWQHSNGTMAEIDRAWELNIPVFAHFNALIAWDKDPKCLADGIRPSHVSKN
jgi:nucleoside 2-deoxyribosyltransferase